MYLRRLAALALSVALLAGCGAQVGSGNKVVRRTVDVLAAASMAKAFTQIAQAYMADHPETEVRLQFAGSAALVAQLAAGGKADVLAVADQETMAKASSAGLVGAAAVFASNRLAIATAPGNPKQVKEFGDLARPGLLLVVCSPQVPCGAAAGEVARRAGVTLRPVSEESNVTDVLAKVTSGTADAGIVYHSDTLRAQVTEVAIPDSLNVVTKCTIAAVVGSGVGDDFVSYVQSPAAAAILVDAGFGRP